MRRSTVLDGLVSLPAPCMKLDRDMLKTPILVQTYTLRLSWRKKKKQMGIFPSSGDTSSFYCYERKSNFATNVNHVNHVTFLYEKVFI